MGCSNMKMLFLLTTIFTMVLTQDPCTTPYKRKGYCVWADDCPPIDAIINNRQRSRSDTLFLRDSLCQTVIINKKPELKVCCDIKVAQPLCKLPNFPQNGSYKVEGEDKKPGTKVAKFTVLTYECEENHVPFPQDVTYCQDTLTWDKTITCNKLQTPTEEKVNKNKQFDPVSLLPSSGECGVNAGNRIFGGNGTTLGEYPWMAIIEHKTKNNETHHICTGTLINKNYVIATANCVRSTKSRIGIPTNIVLGEYNKSAEIDCEDVGVGIDCSDKPIVVPIESIIIHENFNQSQRFMNDLALIRLKTSVEYTDFVSPICLPSEDKTIGIKYGDDYPFIISGWGTTDHTINSDSKKKQRLQYISRDSCQKEFLQAITLNDNQMCANDVGNNVCVTDLGSPVMQLAYEIDLIAIASIVPRPCTTSRKPLVLTKIFPYRNWILSHLEP